MICTPLVGGRKEDVLRELAVILPKEPDVIEWRIDYFKNIGDLAEVLELARTIKEAAGPIPILFVCRSAREGGGTIPLGDGEVVRLYSTLCDSKLVDLIDYELDNPPERREQLRKASMLCSRRNGSGFTLCCLGHSLVLMIGRQRNALRTRARVLIGSLGGGLITTNRQK